MAEDKKSFILYADLLSVVEKLILKDRENKTNNAGELFYHILQYVNDKNPITIDFIVEMAFEPIKQQLKRDLKKYEVIREKRAKAGLASAEKRKQNSTNQTHVNTCEQRSTLSTVNDNDNDTVNVNGNVNDNDIYNNSVIIVENKFSPTNNEKKTIDDRKKIFQSKIEPFKEKYSKETLNDFWRYWTEMNTNGKKMRFESQKFFDVGRRLITWSKNEKNNSHGKTQSNTTNQQRQQRVEEVRQFRVDNQQTLADKLQKYIGSNK